MKKLIASIVVMSLTGCATLTKGVTNRVSVNTDPPGCRVQTQNNITKKSPCVLTFSGYKNQLVTIDKEGYNYRQILLTRRFLKRFWFNIIFWPGMVVDLASGSAWTLEPKNVDVEMKKTSE